MTLMFQREVADRLTASPRSKDYGRLSVLIPWLCATERLINLPAKAFVPPPKVASSVIGVTPRAEPLAKADKKTLERLLAAAFGQRRKMLRTSLKSFIPNPLPDPGSRRDRPDRACRGDRRRGLLPAGASGRRVGLISLLSALRRPVLA